MVQWVGVLKGQKFFFLFGQGTVTRGLMVISALECKRQRRL